MRYYPVYLDVRDRPCLVVGGGRVAERKIQTLLDAGAALTVVSPVLSPRLQEQFRAGVFTYRSKYFDRTDLEGMFLVIASTDSPETNDAVARACREQDILVNVVDPPEEGSFVVPSSVRRGDLMIAVSTGGASPALAKKIRQELEARYGPEYALFLEKLAALRTRIIAEVSDEQRRRNIFHALADSDVIDLLKQGRPDDADRRMEEIAGLID
jgi:precorrin-2 dehydrogenase/sirohydrochlorin ferrochelatase